MRPDFLLIPAVLSLGFGLPGWAQNAPADWTLEGAASSVTFALPTEAETDLSASFGNLSGLMTDAGDASVAIMLDSIETGSALQNARLRLLLFETFREPLARITADLGAEVLQRLAASAEQQIDLPITFTVNGVDQELTVKATLFGVSDDIVALKTVVPFQLALADVNLNAGLVRFEQASQTDITPQIDVSFDLVMRRDEAADTDLTLQSAELKACARQIATIAQSDQVYFTSGSSALEAKSFPLLDAIVDTMMTCPDITLRIEGHTDNVGSESYNKALSIDRAGEVMTYLALRDVSAERLSAMGFGEDRPIADNKTRKGRWKNRRIEFVVFSRDGATRIGWKD